MSVEIYFDRMQVTDGNAPHNNKFGEAANLNDAIEKARAAVANAGGNLEDVSNDDVVIIQNGDSLYQIWEQHAKPQGVTWEEFLQNNLHLKDSKNLSGANQSGRQDYSLVHEGDAVFIPEGPEGSGPEPAIAFDGNNSGPLKKGGDGQWYFTMTDERGIDHDILLNVGDTIIYNGGRYEVTARDVDDVQIQPVDDQGNPLENRPLEVLDLKEISQ